MAKYLFIESRDPFETADTKQAFELASDLSKSGNDVTFYLVQNGVFATRAKAKAAVSSFFSDKEIKILADEYSLQERGIEKAEIDSAVQVSNIDHLVDLLAEENTKAIWH